MDDPLTRRVLEAASLVRRVTAPLLAAMTGEPDSGEGVRRLLELPFVDGGRDGLIVHESVRDAVAGFLRATDPARYRADRRAAWRELRAEIREAGPTELWRYTADMLYLIDNPVVREAFFPTGTQPLVVEPAEARDAPVIRAIARRHDGPAAAALLERWQHEAPGMFLAVREGDGGVAGFFALVDGRMLHPSLVAGDPVLEAWARDLHDRPLPKGQLALGLRRWLDAERGESPARRRRHAGWTSSARTWRCGRRCGGCTSSSATCRATAGRRAARLPPVRQLGGDAGRSRVLERGPRLRPGLCRRVAGRARRRRTRGRRRRARRGGVELTVQGARVALTPLEFGLFRHLRDREGRSVSRGELLHEVWHTDFTGGSNVVDAVVRSLRRKLGHEAVVVETVRGRGYRLRADWRAHLN